MQARIKRKRAKLIKIYRRKAVQRTCTERRKSEKSDAEATKSERHDEAMTSRNQSDVPGDHYDVTESPESEGGSPGVGEFDGGVERDVRVQLGDAHGVVAATVRRAWTFAHLRAPANIRVTTITATDPRN